MYKSIFLFLSNDYADLSNTLLHLCLQTDYNARKIYVKQFAILIFGIQRIMGYCEPYSPCSILFE